MPKIKNKNRNSSKENLLAIDVGNTYIHFALFKAGKIGATFGVNSVLAGSPLRLRLQKVLKNLSVQQVVICSVVPELTSTLEQSIKSELGIKAKVIGRDIRVPVKNLYKDPKQVGQDRLVCAFAAYQLYGHPAIVIDLGTAITLDGISSKKEYLGGIIVPGIQLTTETLFERTALLPLVQFEMPESLIGRDTKTSILSGIYYGYGEMLKGLIDLLKKKVPGKAKVILTGGHAELMAKYIKGRVDAVDKDLVMKGIALLAR
jgi:type III pantothenate kinase